VKVNGDLSMLYRQPTTTDIDMDIVPMSITVCHTNGAFCDVANPDPTESHVYSALEEPPASGEATESVYDLPSNENENEGSVYLQPNVSPTVVSEDSSHVYLQPNVSSPVMSDHSGDEYIHTLESPAVMSEQGGNE